MPSQTRKLKRWQPANTAPRMQSVMTLTVGCSIPYAILYRDGVRWFSSDHCERIHPKPTHWKPLTRKQAHSEIAKVGREYVLAQRLFKKSLAVITGTA